MPKQTLYTDFVVIGAGIVGLTIAYTLKHYYPNKKISIVEKEFDVAQHASGLNSGVLHAGFYYTADSLKAKLCVHGNRIMKAFCKINDIPVNECGKVVVCQDKESLSTLYTLNERAKANGVVVELIDEKQLDSIEPLAKTYRQALYSPTTAVVDPKVVCHKLKSLCLDLGIQFYFDNPVIAVNDQNEVETKEYYIKSGTLINAAGLYADKLAKQVGLSEGKIVLPFKGRYIKSVQKSEYKTHIYPVPNIEQPFLGVHYTLTLDGKVKIGPTAIPAFWRENYDLRNFSFSECKEILYFMGQLFKTNQFGFRQLAITEMKKYSNRYLQRMARSLVKHDRHQYKPMRPGIRAQLFDVESMSLDMDFAVEKKGRGIHILNAVSPAFTCSFAFAEYIVNEFILDRSLRHAA